MTGSSSQPSPHPSPLRWLLTGRGLAWVSLYLVFLGGLLGALLWARQQVLSQADPVAARAHWAEWMETVRRQSEGEGPVRRRPPDAANDTPPALVLMRDFFPICVAATLVFGSALFITVAFLVRGVLTSRPRIDVAESAATEREAPPNGGRVA